MANKFRQEVLNVLLAQLLNERGVVNSPENIIKGGVEQKRRMPDIIVNFSGLRIAIEGEVGDNLDAQSRALESARKRVEESISHIGVAIVYPKQLRKVAFDQLKTELSTSELDIAIVTESGSTQFVKGNVNILETNLRRAFEQLIKEDVVAKAVAVLDEGIDKFANMLIDKSGVMTHVEEVLGIKELPIGDSEYEDEAE